MTEVIHLRWEGPLTFSEIMSRSDRKTDYGVYQVCGLHVSYGAEALLYIGRAQKQTFSVRLRQERWPEWEIENGGVSFYLGRLQGDETPDFQTWDEQIALAEKLLILSHRPSQNAKDLYGWSGLRLQNLHVINWGERGKLLPEV